MNKWMSALLLFALSRVGSADTLPRSWVELAGKRFTVELALDDASRMRGLMHRAELADAAGMLFVFEQEQPLAFWMKNTLIPLDIFYFDRRGRLVGLQTDVPPCRSRYCPSYPSDRPAQFTLELAGGTAARLGVKVGAELTFGPGIPGVPLD